MLPFWIADPLHLALAQACLAVLAALGVVLLARHNGIELLSDTTKAMLRGFVQILAVGAVLGYLLSGPAWTGVLVLFAMLLAAARLGASRAKSFPGAFRTVLTALSLGAGSVIVVMVAVGAIRWEIANLVPVGSMLLSNSMTSSVQLMERLRSDVVAHRGLVETGLALGASPDTAVRRYVQAAVRAAVTPQINTMAALGVVFIPGMMSGMVLAGADPLVAGIYQFVIIAMILAAGGLTAIVAAVLTRRQLFTEAEQLVAAGAQIG